MGRYRLEIIALAIVVTLVGFVGAGMYRLSYDVWAGLVIGPVLLVFTVAMLRRLLVDQLAPLYPILVVGFLAKLLGSVIRYYVVFDAYGKNGDAERYFDAGNALAAQVKHGASMFELVPLARDAQFIEKLTACLFYLIGPTRMGGFFVFSTFAFWGSVSFIRAAAMAVPGLAITRYAMLCVFAPSLVFWPSSLGKEAWILGCIGYFSLGVAKILTWNGRTNGVLLCAASALGMGTVRPHIAAIFVAAFTMAFVQSIVVPPQPVTARRRGSMLLFAVGAVAIMFLTANAALSYFDEGDQSTGFVGGVSNVLSRTTEQTLQGGSSFATLDTSSPTSWPYAIFRTLTRPLIYEANSIATLIPAVETTAFLIALALSWRRILGLPHTLRKAPYVSYALVATMMFGLAFTAVGNLGILVRQRSLVTPFVVLLLCLPKRPPRALRDAPHEFAPEYSLYRSHSQPRVGSLLGR